MRNVLITLYMQCSLIVTQEFRLYQEQHNLQKIKQINTEKFLEYRVGQIAQQLITQHGLFLHRTWVKS